jgi:hypothetical protein
MAHILLGGDLRGATATRAHLLDWGMTVGDWSVGEDWPSVQQCDALILVLPGAEQAPPETTIPARKPAAAPPAPLLLLGELPGSLLLSREAQRVVPAAGPQGVDLKRALEDCLCESRLRREATAAADCRDSLPGYLQFLGHELRSPLTAAKTALEVLQGELGGLQTEAADEGDSRLKMLDIALRNIQRLHRTVDWSQDLLQLEWSLPEGEWKTLDLAEVAGLLPGRPRCRIQEPLRQCTIHADQGLLGVLLKQAVRVLDYVNPDHNLTCRFQGEGDEQEMAVLWLIPEVDDLGSQPPRVVRTGLPHPGDGPEGEALQELASLADYIISSSLLARLQVRVRAVADAGGQPCLTLAFPLGAADRSRDPAQEARHTAG